MKNLTPTTCVHFTGVQHDKCAAGVEYRTLRDVSQPGMARWPCLTHKGMAATTTCALKVLPTPEQVAAAEAELEAMVKQLTDDMAAGKCHVCRAVIDAGEQVGSCIYARPCGHRQGQGNARKFNAGLVKARANTNNAGKGE